MTKGSGTKKPKVVPPDHRTRVGKDRSGRTEARILQAALRVFADKGPDAPRIDDFVQAAGISRGTFYNHYESVEELLESTSSWTTRALSDAIEAQLVGVEGPVMRLGLGLRLGFGAAQKSPVWCRFVARVWSLGGTEMPAHYVEEGVRIGAFRAPAILSRDLFFGFVREALRRIGDGLAPDGYHIQVTQYCLRALGTDPRRISAVMKRKIAGISLPMPSPLAVGRKA